MKQEQTQLSKYHIDLHMRNLDSKDLELIKSVCAKLHVSLYDFFNVASEHYISEARKVVTYIMVEHDNYYFEKIMTIIRASKFHRSNIHYLYHQSVNHYKNEDKFRSIVNSILPICPKFTGLHFYPSNTKN
jgi:hypothetical protein